MSNAVTGVAVNATARTVTLTLTTAVTQGQQVSVAYRDPSADDDSSAVQDSAGNDAASFAATDVTNNTPQVVVPDSTPPTLVSIVVANTSLRAGQATNAIFRFSEAVKDFDASDLTAPGLTLGAFTHNADNTVWTVALTAAEGTERAGNTIGVNMAGVNDLAGNAGSASSMTSNAYSVDSVAPAIARATVNGRQLVLTYTEGLALDATHTAASSAFAVLVNGQANAVTAVAVDATNKTVTLTLTSAVTAGQTVTIAYTDPSTGDDASAVQDAAGNDAASQSDYTVRNDTPDTTGPTHATITLADSLLSAGESTLVTFQFDEAVHMDANAAVTVPTGCTLAGLTAIQPDANGRSNRWTATLTQTGANSAASNTLTLDLSKVQDTGGAAGSGSTSAQFATDTVAPQITGATVNGRTLTLSYGEALASNIDAAVKAAFKVKVGAAEKAIESLSVDAQHNTITLTLVDPIANGQTAITVSYSDANPGNDASGVVQDAAGNDAPSQSDYTVRNDTPDTTRPTLTGIDVSPASLKAGEHATVTFTFSEAVTGLDGSGVVTTSAGSLSDWSHAEGSLTWTARLTPAAGTESQGNTISVNMAGVQDAAHNAGAGSRTLGNYSVDTLAPALSGAPTVIGNQLTLTFNQALDAAHKPANSAFAVLVNGTANTVTNVAVNAADKTVTLTLTTAVAHGDRVSVAYTDPSANDDANAVQDSVGNDAAGFAATDVTNNTAPPPDTSKPTLTSIVVAPASLKTGEHALVTFSFSEPVTGLDGSGVVSASGGALSEWARTGDGSVWTARLTPNANTESAGNAITVNLAGVRDAAGNAGSGTSKASNDYSVDTVAPAIGTATVNGSQLVLTYTEGLALDATNTAAASAFAVLVNGTANAVTAVAVDATAKTVTLTLTRAVTAGQSVTVNYTDPGAGDDANAVQDRAGNDAASLEGQTVRNNTPAAAPPPDATAPTITAIAVAPASLRAGQRAAVTFTFSEAVTGFGTDDVSVPGGTLSDLASNADKTIWTATLTPNANTESAGNAITVNLAGVRDTAGNAGSGTSRASNDYSADTVAPVLRTASVNGSQLVLTYTEGLGLDATHIAAASAFAVLVNGQANAVTAVAVDANAKTVTLTLTRAVSAGQSVTVSYTDPSANDDANAVQDRAGNDAASSSALAVRNDTAAPDTTAPDSTPPDSTAQDTTQPDTTPPVFTEATVSDRRLVLRYTDANPLDAEHTAAAAAFTVLVNGSATAVSAVAVDAAQNTVTLTLASAVARGAAVTVSYRDPTAADDSYAVQDAAGNDAASLDTLAVTNHSDPGLDTDSDGIPDTTEDQAPGVHRSAAAGDGNGDAIADSAQATVGSARFVSSPKSESNPANAAGHYVTLVMDSQDGKTSADPGSARIISLTQKDTPANLPDALDMPMGLASFQVALAQGRSSEQFSLYLDPDLGVNGYWIKDSAGTWVNLASAAWGGKMVREGERLRLDFRIDDGGQFDADGAADGAITALGAAAQMPLSILGQAPDVGAAGFWL